LVSPHDVEGLANALYLVLTNDDLRRDLVSRGFERASQFSWEKTAAETLKVYDSVEHALSTDYVPVEIEERVALKVKEMTAEHLWKEVS